jgi:hypothetical protein
MGTASAQTLGELAEAQRMKQQAEMLKAAKELEAAEANIAMKSAPAPDVAAKSQEDARKAARLAEEAARPKVVLHALYARNGIWIAEMASNQELALALVGMRVRGYQVTGIGQHGVTLTKPCNAKDVREKRGCGTRLLAVGEAI